jgi:molybdopterin molybdotransferase
MSTVTSVKQVVSCLDDYDPDALKVERAREAIKACLVPIAGTERVAVRSALGRVLAQRHRARRSTCPHTTTRRWTAMPCARPTWPPSGDTVLSVAGTGLRRRAVRRPASRAGQCARVMTGAVMPEGADTVVIQEVVTQRRTAAIVVPAGQKPKARTCATPARTSSPAKPVLRPGRLIRPAELGLFASLGHGRGARCGAACAWPSSPPATNSPRSASRWPRARSTTATATRCGACWQRLGVDLIDMGVVRDDPALLEAAFLTRRARRRRGRSPPAGSRVGEADFTKQVMMAKLGEVLFWKIAMRPGRPMAIGRITRSMAGRRRCSACRATRWR